MAWYNEITYMTGKWTHFWYINTMYLNLLFDKIITFKNDEVLIKYNPVFGFLLKFKKMWHNYCFLQHYGISNDFPYCGIITVPYKSSIFQDILDTPYLRFKIPNKFWNTLFIHQLYQQIQEILHKINDPQKLAPKI